MLWTCNLYHVSYKNHHILLNTGSTDENEIKKYIFTNSELNVIINPNSIHIESEPNKGNENAY